MIDIRTLAFLGLQSADPGKDAGVSLPELPADERNPFDIGKKLMDGIPIVACYFSPEVAKIYQIYRIECDDLLCTYLVDFHEGVPHMKLHTVHPMNKDSLNELWAEELKHCKRIYMDPDGAVEDMQAYIHDVSAEEIRECFEEKKPFFYVEDHRFLTDEKEI